MATFSQKSLDILATVDRKLYDLCTEVIKDFDFSVIVGHRGEADQDIACANGKSNTPWPTSKHNSCPSQAVDIAPYPIDWNDINRFRELAGAMYAAGNKLGIKIRWGGDFTKLKDYDHFELVE